jgi:hypothetical protein
MKQFPACRPRVRSIPDTPTPARSRCETAFDRCTVDFGEEERAWEAEHRSHIGESARLKHFCDNTSDLAHDEVHYDSVVFEKISSIVRSGARALSRTPRTVRLVCSG